MAAKIRKNDKVIVIAGKSKGKIGIVQKVIDRSRVIIRGINLFIKHQKPNPSKNEVGGIIKKEASLHISNVGILNKETGKADRVGFIIKSGKKIRIFKSNKKIIE